MISQQTNMCLYLRHTKLLFHFLWWLQVPLWWHPIMYISNPIESLRLYVQSFSWPKLRGSVNTVDTHRHTWSYRSYSHITSWVLTVLSAISLWSPAHQKLFLEYRYSFWFCYIKQHIKCPIIVFLFHFFFYLED